MHLNYVLIEEDTYFKKIVTTELVSSCLGPIRECISFISIKTGILSGRPTTSFTGHNFASNFGSYAIRIIYSLASKLGFSTTSGPRTSGGALTFMTSAGACEVVFTPLDPSASTVSFWSLA